MEQKSNKTIVAEFYKKIVGQRDSSLINTYVREDYIQHSAAGKAGRQGLFEMVEFLKTLPPSTETQSPVKRLIGEGELVVIQLDIAFMGKRMVVLDLFRLADGMLAEHWDAVQEITADNDNMTGGARIIDAKADTAANKALVAAFYLKVFANAGADLMPVYLDEKYLEHNVAEPLTGYIENIIKVRRVIAEGDFAVVQSEYVKQSQSFVLYDILRIADGKIVEHWSVNQLIPAVMQHNNGML
ncbi:nuclear transport factor 2 family protein [Mucilaginibacter sp. UR6-11]|uniref:nuclear transport factor 2 family protein n=1 Tax=Mucilaginibacter sp. UR6-11 TaxID=1435644 RepID=UPI001E28E9D5|nr:nuclear transport factor 2 family protein [Mucilaginibacter sp. UR6-11]MCC8423413.1 hypothetical protein [Mucilaginibacter sp. UR6-11]